ncbi:thiopeptide-type bacteriocin biosynthesis protein [Weissella sp. MSCH1]|uniref:thiopeptide-type bacteriocin biosynthesis protein n=1 Tax=Weissella sp. MSCH1 TaxID=3383343 RepID=UPI003896951E
MKVSFQKENQLIRTHVNDGYVYINNEFDEKIITYYQNHKILMEQLRVANKSLFNSVTGYDKTKVKPKKTTKIVNSLSKYYLRSLTRSTPFGLFSGVYSSKWPTNYQRKEISISFEWLYKYLEQFVKKHPEEFYFSTSSFITEDSERVILNYGETGNVTLKNSRALKLLQEFTLESPKKYKELITWLEYKYDSEDSEFFDGYLRKLIDNGVLIVEKIISKESTIFDLENNLKSISNWNEENSKLKELTTLIRLYEQSKLGEGVNLFNDIDDLMQSMVPVAKDDLTVNLYGKYGQVNELNDEVISNLNRLFTHLINGSQPYDELYEYRMKFLEKFGVDAEIKLVDLINPVYGLGMPEYKVDLESFSKKQTNLVRNLFDRAKHNNNKIILTDKQLDQFENPKNVQNVYPGEVLFEQSGKDHTLTLGGIFGSKTQRSLWSRFHNLDDINIPEKSTTDRLLVGANAAPKRKGLMGITTNKNFFDYELTLNMPKTMGKKQINIDDLLVGFNQNSGELYLKHSTSEKLIELKDLNMLNPDLKNPIIKLLGRLAEQNSNWFFNHPLFQLAETETIVPEVWYEGIRLIRKTWRLPFYLASGQTPELSEWKKEFKNQIQELGISRFVRSGNSDAVFIVDTTNDNSLEVLYKSLVGRSEEMYTLSAYSEDECINNGEIIVEYNIDDYNFDSKHNIIRQKPVFSKDELTTPKTIEDGWVFMDLEFITVEKRDYFVEKELKNLFNIMSDDGDKQFFIRYQNGATPSVRYRVKTSNGYQAFKKIYPEILKLHSDAKISSHSLLPYYPETHRYGSDANISTIEYAFSSESKYILEKIDNDEQSKMIVLLTLMKQVVHALGYTATEMKSAMEKFFDLKPANNEFGKRWLQDNKTLVNKFVSEWETVQNFDSDNIKERELNLKKINLTVLDIDQKMNLISGIWHMTFNRLIAIDREKENNTLFVFYKILCSVVYMENK